MATDVFFRDSHNASSHRWTSGTNLANRAGTSTGWTGKFLSTSRGSSAKSQNRSTVAGPTSGIEPTVVSDVTSFVEWISPPIDTDVTISGTITLNLRCAESNMSANCAINAIIERIGSDGAVVSTIATTARTTEMAVTTETAENFTVSPTSTSMLKGDRIRIRIYADDAGTMASGHSYTFWFDGPTAAASGDSWVRFNENFGFLTTDPTTTTIYLTDDASAVSTADEDLEAWTTPGASIQEARTNTVAGWTTPIQCKLGTSGTGASISWFTRPLQAFTLAGPVLASLKGEQSGVTAQTSFRCEIAIVDGD